MHLNKYVLYILIKQISLVLSLSIIILKGLENTIKKDLKIEFY